MSEEILVKVSCHHSGKFVSKNGVLDYIDGVVDVLELDSATIFTDLVSKMFERRIVIGKMWFKLPFQDTDDRKPLWKNVEKNKKKMEAAGRWYKELDVYVEVVDISSTAPEPSQGTQGNLRRSNRLAALFGL